MPRQGNDVGEVGQRRSMPKRSQRRAVALSAASLAAILVCAVEAGAQDRPEFGEAAACASPPSAASPCEIRARRVMREHRPLWRRVLALPADALELAFWPLQQTLFWMERYDVPGRVRDAALEPIDALTGAAPEAGRTP
jgi:hypothetical protein